MPQPADTELTPCGMTQRAALGSRHLSLNRGAEHCEHCVDLSARQCAGHGREQLGRGEADLGSLDMDMGAQPGPDQLCREQDRGDR